MTKTAVQSGFCNFVIAHEPLFYGHRDETAQLERENDDVWKLKRDFLAQNELVVWRFHDLPHWQKPDAISSGMADELGWRGYQSSPGQTHTNFGTGKRSSVLAVALPQKR